MENKKPIENKDRPVASPGSMARQPEIVTAASKGTLFVLATPLGNLEDMTFRAVRVLREADLVAAEDTRRTRKLMTHYGIRTKLISYRDENHDRVWPGILHVLASGGRAVLVTDAGTPGISDPGARIVSAAAREGASVVPIPGATAVAAALSVSGLGADSYLFVGFLPAKKKARLDLLEAVSTQRNTLVFFEAPHRLAESLSDAALVLGDRRAALCREMTKMNEEYLHGSLPFLAGLIAGRPGPVRGEITLVVEGAPPAEPLELTAGEIEDLVRDDPRQIKEIAADLSKRTAYSRSDLYRLILKAKGRD